MQIARLVTKLRTGSRNYATLNRSSTPATMTRSTSRPKLKFGMTRQTVLLGGKRAYSSAPSSSSSMLSPLFTALLAFGVAATAYGIYEIYGTMTIWPQEVRSDLREAIKAKHKEDFKTSIAYLQKAWETTKTLPIEIFKTQPYLKTSGIAVCLAEILEAEDKKLEAYDVYVEALKQLQDAGIKDLSGPEKLRAVALAYKLGELSGELQKPEEEQWLTFGVETVLKHVLEVPAVIEENKAANEEGQLIISELDLPDWVSTVDVAAPLEALGTFYSKVGKLDFAMPLMLQAVSILIPAPPQESTPEDRCRGAQLMTSISEMIIRNSLTRETVQQAEQWATKGLEVVVATRKASSEPIGICEVAYAVQLFNIASLRAIGGDIERAKDLFRRCAKQSQAIGYHQLVKTSNDALEEIESRTAAPKAT